MKIDELFEVVLPAKEVGLDVRLEELGQREVNVAIYVSNFLPFACQVTVTGNRRLAIATLEDDLTAEQVLDILKSNGTYCEAVVEDLIAMTRDPRLITGKYLTGDNTAKYPAIVCLGSRFEMMGPEYSFVTPHVFFDEPIGQLTVGLAPEDASFTPGVGFLVVCRQ